MSRGRPQLGLVALLALVLPLPAFCGSRGVEKGSIAPFVSREDEVPAGTWHRWTMAVASDRVYEVRVEQLGQNLKLTLDPGDGTTRKVDDRRGWSGTESVRWVAPRAGKATLRLAPATERAGRYRLELRALGRATEEDRRRDEAERLMASGAETDQVASWRAAAKAFAALRLPEREVVALFKLSNAAAGSADATLFPEALESAARGLAIAERLADDDARAECHYARAGALWVAGRLDEAEQAYLESAALYESRREHGPLAFALDALSGLSLARGDVGKSQSLIERERPLAEEDGNHRLLTIAENRLASIFGRRGQYSESLAAFEAARDRALRANDRYGALEPLVNIGIVYGQLGDPERSLAHLREALGRARREKESGELRALVVFLHTAIAAEHEDLGDDGEAASEYRRALELSRSTAGWTGAAAEAARGLGALEARRGDVTAAEAHLAMGLAQAVAFGDEALAARTRLEQARGRVRAGKLEAAEAPLNLAMETLGRIGSVEDEAAGWSVRAELARARGDLTGAFDSVTHALAIIESVRARVSLLEERARYLGARRSTYDLAVRLLVERDRREPAAGHLARAFEMSERAHARSLLDDEAPAAAGLDPSSVPASRRRAAFERIARLQRDLLARRTSGSPDEGAIARLERDLNEAVEEEERERRALRARDSRVERVLEPTIVSAAMASSTLAPDEALIEYTLGREESWAFVLDATSLRVFPLGPEKRLRDLVNGIRASLARPSLFGAASYAASASAAFQVLLAPVGPRLDGYRRLRIVPDGPLWELPFEALVSAKTGSRWSDLAYVVNRWQVAYEPSASVAALERRAPAGPEGPLLVAFANPSAPRGEVVGAAARAVERAALRASETWSLPPLACAEREARRVALDFGAGRAKVFLGAAARESRAKRDVDVARARYLLFATHGVVSERLPSQSGLVLSLPGDGGEDGLLQAYEIADLELRARLVVLSACDSALGPNVRGEGLLGIARAFLQAGAGGIVASLWRVSDCSAAELVPSLFRGLESPSGPREAAAALRGAKLVLLRGGTYAHPYYWAPFVLLTANACSPAPLTSATPCR